MIPWRGWLVFRQYIKNKDINTELNSLNYAQKTALNWRSKSILEKNSQILNDFGGRGLPFYTSWNITLTNATVCSLTTGTILYHSQNICQRGTHILLVPCELIESKTHHKQLERSFKRVKWFSCPLVTFLSLSGKTKEMFVSSAMLMCQQWWIQSTGIANSKGNRKLFLSTTTICRELIDQIKCCCITLHCKKL